MAQITRPQFCSQLRVLEDDAVAFTCATDVSAWPWLALPPDDPIVIQMVNFFVSVEAGLARGEYDPTKWSALTQTDWVCGDIDSGHATHGIAETFKAENTSRYRLTFFTATGRLLYRMSGTGVVFRNRDFEGWRAKQKLKHAEQDDLDAFAFAPAQRVGVETQIESFVAPLQTLEASATQALITADNGMPPAHPYLDGSGDHVNSTHIADLGRQFARLVTGVPSLRFVSGDMEFLRYVELGRRVDIMRISSPSDTKHISLQISQNGKLCARMSLGCAPD